MFGRRRRKREVVSVEAPHQWPVCGQVYLFNREREDRERAESDDGPKVISPRSSSSVDGREPGRG